MFEINQCGIKSNCKLKALQKAFGKNKEIKQIRLVKPDLFYLQLASLFLMQQFDFRIKNTPISFADNQTAAAVCLKLSF